MQQTNEVGKNASSSKNESDASSDVILEAAGRFERPVSNSSASVLGLDSDSKFSAVPGDIDVFRDTPVRLLGYANEVGESFRALVPVSVVRWSYAVAASYVVADTADKSWKMYKKDWVTLGERNQQVGLAAVDALIWQSLASVIIPGFTINRICAFSLYALRHATKLPPASRKWATTVVGLSCIPFIIKPIDHSVDLLLDVTLRKWLGVDIQNKKWDP